MQLIIVWVSNVYTFFIRVYEDFAEKDLKFERKLRIQPYICDTWSPLLL